MLSMLIPAHDLEIHPVRSDELQAVLQVYRQCEDFLALGPVTTASMEMVLKDLELSRSEGGLFCGIYDRQQGEMIGVLDFVPSHWQGEASQAFLELLMLATPFRSRSIGQAVFEALEAEIRKDPAVRTLLAGVQVNNPQAIKFWQRMGFQIVSEARDCPDGTTAYALEKQL